MTFRSLHILKKGGEKIKVKSVKLPIIKNNTKMWSKHTATDSEEIVKAERDEMNTKLIANKIQTKK